MNAIELKHVKKTYKTFSIDDLNLTLPGGAILGLVGENGAGKSTTIHMILGLVKEDSGEILVLGSDIKKDAAMREDIGVVLDSAIGMPLVMTVKEIGKMMKGIYRRWNADLFSNYLKQFAIDEKKRFSELSKGMKMKLEIAIALSHGAKLLILDEATSGLDPVVRDEVLDIFMEFTRNEENAVLISSHIVGDLEKICDYIAFLQNGTLILCEEKDALCERYAVIHGTAEDLQAIDQNAILGKNETPYGVEAVVERQAVPHGFDCGKVGLEEIFVYMMRRKR